MSTFKTRQELSVLLFRLDKETTGNLLWKAIDEYFYISIFFLYQTLSDFKRTQGMYRKAWEIEQGPRLFTLTA